MRVVTPWPVPGRTFSRTRGGGNQFTEGRSIDPTFSLTRGGWTMSAVPDRVRLSLLPHARGVDRTEAMDQLIYCPSPARAGGGPAQRRCERLAGTGWGIHPPGAESGVYVAGPSALRSLASAGTRCCGLNEGRVE